MGAPRRPLTRALAGFPGGRGPAVGGGAQAAVFVGNVQVQGNLQVSGTIGPTPPPAGASAATAAGVLRGMESPKALVETVGESQLVGGRAEVRFDPTFAAALLDARYHVVLTAYDDHSALFVTRRMAQGFEVRAKDSPTAASAFSYRVVGRRRDAEFPRRVGDAGVAGAESSHVPAVPATQGAPSLPSHAETTVPALAPPRSEPRRR